MKRLCGFILCGALATALAGCSNAHSEVKALNEVKPVGSPFTQTLAHEYRDFANSEMNRMFDYPDAIHFARKGLAAAAGETVLPEPISDWNLPAGAMDELAVARGRLLVSFDLGSREKVPEKAAVAQARFDCWIEQQEEDDQGEDINNCKSAFMSAMGAVESIVGTTPPAPPAEAPPIIAPPPAADLAPIGAEGMPAPTGTMRPEDAMYLVFFDFDASNVGAGGQNVLDAVVQEVKSRNLNMIRIVGHTDSSGPNSYNNRLAMRRANAVRDALTQRGIDASLIRVEGRGEKELLVKTADGVREPANRRAQITFQ